MSVSRSVPAFSRWGNTSGQLSESEEKHLRLRVKQLIYGRLNGMRIRQSLLQPYVPRTGADPLEGTAAGSWSLGIVEQSQGKDCCWLQRDGWRGCEGGDRGGKCLWGKARKPWKQGDTAEYRRGWSHHHSLSLPTQHLQLKNREAGPSNAWHPELQIGPHLGAPLTDAPICRVGPQQGSPLSAWMGGATQTDWPERPSDRQLQQAQKKDSDRAITPAAEAVHVPAHFVLPGTKKSS